MVVSNVRSDEEECKQVAPPRAMARSEIIFNSISLIFRNLSLTTTTEFPIAFSFH